MPGLSRRARRFRAAELAESGWQAARAWVRGRTGQAAFLRDPRAGPSAQAWERQGKVFLETCRMRGAGCLRQTARASQARDTPLREPLPFSHGVGYHTPLVNHWGKNSAWRRMNISFNSSPRVAMTMPATARPRARSPLKPSTEAKMARGKNSTLAPK